MTTKLMAHMVSGYPNIDTSIAVGRALVAGGCSFLEVQFPFSDPTADGPAIQDACTRALDAGFRVSAGFDTIRALAGDGGVPIFIMSYASVVVAFGVPRFVEEAKAAGASGLIIPDLPIDADEGLFAAGRARGVHVVPVVVPTMRDDRINLVLAAKPEYVYAALRTGITGSYTEIGEANLAFLDRLHPIGAKILAGFGVQEHAQVAALQPHVHAVVSGSALVRIVRQNEGSPQRIAEAVRAKTAELVGTLPIDV